MRPLLWGLAAMFVAQAALAEDENPAEQSVARKDRGEQLSAEQTAHTQTRLDDTSEKRASLAIATYADSDNVTVFTPSLAASITNVLQGASLRGQYVVDAVSAASADVVSTASPRWTEVRHAGRSRRRTNRRPSGSRSRARCRASRIISRSASARR